MFSSLNTHAVCRCVFGAVEAQMEVLVFLWWCHRGRIRCNRVGGVDGVIARPGGASRARWRIAVAAKADATVAPAAGIERRQPGHPSKENMEAIAEELRAGSRIPVTVDQIVNDTLVVTLTYRERSYTGILLDCSRKWVAFLCVFMQKHNFCDVGPKQQARRTQSGLSQRQWEEQQPPPSLLSSSDTRKDENKSSLLCRIVWFSVSCSRWWCDGWAFCF